MVNYNLFNNISLDIIWVIYRAVSDFLTTGDPELIYISSVLLLLFIYIFMRAFLFVRTDKAIKSCVVKDDSIIRGLIFIVFRFDRETKKFWHRIGRSKFAYFEKDYSMMYQWAIPTIICRLICIIGIAFLIVNYSLNIIPQSIIAIAVYVYDLICFIYIVAVIEINKKLFARQYEAQFSEEDFKKE